MQNKCKSKETIEYAMFLGCTNCQVICINQKKNQVSYENGKIHNTRMNINKYIIQLIYKDRFGSICIDSSQIEDYKDIIMYIIDNSCLITESNKYIYELFKKYNIDSYNKSMQNANEISYDLEFWIKKQKETIEEQFKCSLINIFYEINENTVTKINGLKEYINSEKKSNMVLLAKVEGLPPVIHIINDVDINNSIVENLEKSNFEKKLHRRLNLECNELKGRIKFSCHATKVIIDFLINMFNSEYILNNRCALKKDCYNKNLFKESINLSKYNNEDLHLFDYEGVITNGKYLIKEGKVVDLLNNMRTKSIIGGTAGDMQLINIKNEVSLGFKNVMLDIDEKLEKNYDVFIEEIDEQRSIFDLSTGMLSLIAYGINKDLVSDESNVYTKSVNILNIINKMKPASKNKEIFSFFVPDVIVNIE